MDDEAASDTSPLSPQSTQTAYSEQFMVDHLLELSGIIKRRRVLESIVSSKESRSAVLRLSEPDAQKFLDFVDDVRLVRLAYRLFRCLHF